MTAHLRLAAGTVLIVSVLGITGAAAQSIGPDESLGAPGTMTQQTVLTPQQRRAIYEAVRRERVGSPEVSVAAVVGATVLRVIARDEAVAIVVLCLDDMHRGNQGSSRESWVRRRVESLQQLLEISCG